MYHVDSRKDVKKVKPYFNFHINNLKLFIFKKGPNYIHKKTTWLN